MVAMLSVLVLFSSLCLGQGLAYESMDSTEKEWVITLQGDNPLLVRINRGQLAQLVQDGIGGVREISALALSRPSVSFGLYLSLEAEISFSFIAVNESSSIPSVTADCELGVDNILDENRKKIMLYDCRSDHPHVRFSGKLAYGGRGKEIGSYVYDSEGVVSVDTEPVSAEEGPVIILR